MVRATHGISSGSWYFEAIIQEMPENSATRIGWAMASANLQVIFNAFKIYRNSEKIRIRIPTLRKSWKKYALHCFRFAVVGPLRL